MLHPGRGEQLIFRNDAAWAQNMFVVHPGARNETATTQAAKRGLEQDWDVGELCQNGATQPETRLGCRKFPESLAKLMQK